jgi:hypothetical protein
VEKEELQRQWVEEREFVDPEMEVVVDTVQVRVLVDTKAWDQEKKVYSLYRQV